MVHAGLVTLTWGNVSGADRDQGVMAIKPSGVPYDRLQPEDIVVLSIKSGEVLEGSLSPSSDTPTHLVLYRVFPGIGAVVHTHSKYATGWAQAGLEIPCLGTTHADHFRGSVPVTRPLRNDEVENDYEKNTGMVIFERFRDSEINPNEIPAVLVNAHGPFVWGKSLDSAIENAITLEYVAECALLSTALNPNAIPISKVLLKKHFGRKNGKDAYYGQNPKP
ncbi:MAG TPA: L-ribulose-5-phosphate 4-epimerase AraD [bacterium]|nr:L-ribulose-5-phosphate 4-epimerase AraD [bacterium]